MICPLLIRISDLTVAKQMDARMILSGFDPLTLPSISRNDLVPMVIGAGARINGDPIRSIMSATTRLGHNLRMEGAQHGDVVAIEGFAGAEFLTAVLAVWQLGGVPLPCLGMPAAHIAKQAYVLQPDGSVRRPRVTGKVAGLETTAVLHSTSGSTDEPKIVKRGLASVLCEAIAYSRGVSWSFRDHVFVPISVIHSYGWGFLLSALLAGCDVALATTTHARRTARRIAAEGISVVALSGPLARVLAQTPIEDGTAQLRVAMVGAGQITEDLNKHFTRRFGCQLWRNYGCSETGPTFMGPGDLPATAIGYPINGVRILAPGLGQRGELHLALDAPVEGYLDERTPPSNEWHSGDLVLRDKGDVTHFIERLRPALRVNGITVNAQAIDGILRAHPGVEDVYLIAVSRPSPREFEDLYAVIAGDRIDRAAIDTCRPDLPEEARSLRVVVCPALPKDNTGKPDRAKIRALAITEWSPVK